MPGPDRTERSSLPPEASSKIPRPPNAWILFRSDMSRSIDPNTVDSAGRPARKTQAAVSKEISELWRNADPHIRAEYERRADAKKAEHSIQYPNYRFAPVKKEDKQKLKEEKKQLKDQERVNKRRVRPTPYTPPSTASQPPITGTPAPYLPPQMTTFFPNPFSSGYAPSPPFSAYGSPEDSLSSGDTLLENKPSLSLDGTTPPSTDTSDDNSLTLPATSEQPIAGPSHWPDQPQSSGLSWPGDSSQQNVSPGFVQFDIPQQPWMVSDIPMDILCSTTADPTVYQLEYDNQLMPDHSLEFLMPEPLDPTLFPDMRHLDFSSLLEGVPNTDIFGVDNDATPAIDPALFTDFQPQNFNGDEFIDFEQAQSSSRTSSTQVSTPAPVPEQSVPVKPEPVLTSSYTPPAGAAFSSQRRVAGSWSRSFAETSSSPQPAQISASAN